MATLIRGKSRDTKIYKNFFPSFVCFDESRKRLFVYIQTYEYVDFTNVKSGARVPS